MAAYKLLGLAVIVFLQSFSGIHAQENYAVHANIIYHFTKYIDWPEDKKLGDFIIGVVGETPLYDELIKNIGNKTVGYQRIVIRRFSALASFFYCHILFISEKENRNLKRIDAATEGTAVLIVTEDAKSRKGSCINFVIIHEHLKLQINKTNIEHRGLGIATELLSLGETVK